MPMVTFAKKMWRYSSILVSWPCLLSAMPNVSELVSWGIAVLSCSFFIYLKRISDVSVGAACARCV